jgi:hypothetical protein
VQGFGWMIIGIFSFMSWLSLSQEFIWREGASRKLPNTTNEDIRLARTL